MTWPRVVTLIKKKSPHAYKPTVSVHIGMKNSACDGHCGGFKGVVTGELQFDIDVSIGRPNIKFDLHVQCGIYIANRGILGSCEVTWTQFSSSQVKSIMLSSAIASCRRNLSLFRLLALIFQLEIWNMKSAWKSRLEIHTVENVVVVDYKIASGTDSLAWGFNVTSVRESH